MFCQNIWTAPVSQSTALLRSRQRELCNAWCRLPLQPPVLNPPFHVITGKVLQVKLYLAAVGVEKEVWESLLHRGGTCVRAVLSQLPLRLCCICEEKSGGEAVGPQYLPVAAWVNVLARDSQAGRAELREKSCCAGAGFPLDGCFCPMPLAAAWLSATCELNLQQQSSISVLWSNNNIFF